MYISWFGGFFFYKSLSIMSQNIDFIHTIYLLRKKYRLGPFVAKLIIRYR